MRLRRRMLKQAIESSMENVLGSAELLSKKFEKIYDEPEIGFNVEGKGVDFTFMVPIQGEDAVDKIEDVIDNSNQLKELIIDTLMNKCTSQEQFGFVWGYGKDDEKVTYSKDEVIKNIYNVGVNITKEEEGIVLIVSFDSIDIDYNDVREFIE